MHDSCPLVPSLQSIRVTLEKGKLHVSDFSSKEKKISWIRKTLQSVGYVSLSKEDKGLVRAYIQEITGYSRAQAARHITTYIREGLDTFGGTLVLEASASGHFFPVLKRNDWIAVGCIVLALLIGGALAFSQRAEDGDQDDQEVMIDDSHLAAPDKSGSETLLGSITQTSMSNEDASLAERLVRQEQRLLERLASKQAEEALIEQSDMSMVQNGSPVRRSRLFATMQSFYDLLVGGATERQILMYKNGEPSWVYTAPPVIRGERSEGSYSPVRRGGGGG